ncbi:hypothetical protein AB0K21_08495 [Streptosporangium sp. NPDC049248]|uniref:hypothetical protein n=1 Tax=Streptosporangium sp. NPDC049248 TaxID=3155651 RepID=UPI003431B262
MNLLKSLLRAVAGAALVVPLLAPATSASASDAAPYVRITLNTIVPWRTLGNGGDEIFVKISGPGLIPLTTTTYRVWPPSNGVHPVTSGYCYTFENAPCPPGSNDQSWKLITPSKPIFLANGGLATINIRDNDVIFADDDVFLQSFRLNPLTQESRYTLRPNAGRTDTSDYQVNITLTPVPAPF